MWMGLRFTSDDDQHVVRMVLQASATMVALDIVMFVLKVTAFDHQAGFVGVALMRLLVGLLIPVCGYLGAKLSNRCLMGAFCGASWLSLLGYVVLLVILFQVWPVIAHEHVEHILVSGQGCPPGSTTIANQEGCRDAQGGLDFNECVNMLRIADDAVICEVVQAASASKKSALILMGLLLVCNGALAPYAGWYGLSLFQRLGRGEVLVGRPMGTAGEELDPGSAAQGETEDVE